MRWIKRDVTLQQIKDAIQIDGVLTLRQLKHHVPAVNADWLVRHDIPVFDLTLPTSKYSLPALERVVALKDPSLKYSHFQISHLLGVAEMRIQLAAQQGWQGKAFALRKLGQPDAFWQHDQGITAIEYDAGTYTPRQVRLKLLHFQGFHDLVWGTPSAVRARHLRRTFAFSDLNIRVLETRWWTAGQ